LKPTLELHILHIQCMSCLPKYLRKSGVFSSCQLCHLCKLSYNGQKIPFQSKHCGDAWLDSGMLNNEWLCCQLLSSGLKILSRETNDYNVEFFGWNVVYLEVLTLLSIPSPICISYFTFWSCWEMRCGSLHNVWNVYHFPPSLPCETERWSQIQNLTTADITHFSHAPNFSNTERNVNSLQDNTYCHIHSSFRVSYPYLLVEMKGMIKANFIQLPTENTHTLPWWTGSVVCPFEWKCTQKMGI
jgi:hypothetical protein